jgi:hypothetical protein
MSAQVLIFLGIDPLFARRERVEEAECCREVWKERSNFYLSSPEDSRSLSEWRAANS